MIKQKNNERAITLIALVITIIILLILSGVAISSLNGENGLFANVKLAKEKQAIAQAKEELELDITELTIEQQSKGKNLVKEDLIKLNSDELEIGSTDNFPVEAIYKGLVFNIDEKFVVTYIGKAEGKTIVTYTTEPEGYVKDGNIVIKLKISNSNGISKIQDPNNTENDYNGKTSVSIDYPVTANGTYTFKIIDVNGNETIKNIVIDKYDAEPAVVESQEIGLNTNYKLKIKVKDELSGLKRIKVTATITDDSSKEKTVEETVTLSGEYEKEEEIDIGLKYNYTLTAYTIETEDQAGNIKVYDATVTLPIKNEVLRITSEEDLIYFGTATEKNRFNGKTVYLDSDITLTQEWIPMSSGTSMSFQGTFEGNNHTISGLTNPLFADNSGTIQNLNVVVNVNYSSGSFGSISVKRFGDNKELSCFWNNYYNKSSL